MTQPINLRGHHVSIFAEYMLGGHNPAHVIAKKRHDLSGIDNVTNPDDTNHDELHTFFKKSSKVNVVSSEPFFIRPATQAKDLYDYLISHPKTEVMIVEGLDSICGGCRFLEDACSQDSDGEDIRTLQEYGLEVGQTYTAGTLIERIRRYQRTTGFTSPRTVFF